MSGRQVCGPFIECYKIDADRGVPGMIRLIATAAFSAALASSANAEITIPDGMMPSFNFQFVEPTLQAAGVPYRRMQINENFSVLEMSINGVTFLAAPLACQNAMCAGFMLEKSFDGTLNADQMAAMNSRNKIVTVSRPKDSPKTMANRYLIGDYGYIRGSFIVNLLVFANIVKKLEIEIASGAASSVSYDPSAAASPSAPVAPGVKILGDDFADKLNARQKSVMVSNQSPEPTSSAAEPWLHEQFIGAPLLSDELGAGVVNHVD